MTASDPQLPHLPALQLAADDFLLGAQTVKSMSIILKVLLVAISTQLAISSYLEGFHFHHVGSYVALALFFYSNRALKNGKTRHSITVLLGGAITVISIQCFIVAGVSTPALLYAPALCVMAAWLLGIRAGVVMMGYFVLLLVALVLADNFHFLGPPVQRPAVTIASIVLTATLIALVITAGAITLYKQQIERVLELSKTQAVQLEALKKSEQRFSALFKANPTPSSTVDDEGRTKDVNDAWIALFGISEEAAHDKTTQELGLWTDPEVRAEVLAEFNAQGRVSGMPVQFNTASGPRPFLLYIAPVEFGGGRRLVTSLVDQTDRLAAEAAQRAETEALEERVARRTAELSQTVARLQTMQQELVQSEKLASLGSMVAGISHELNTPIGNTVTVSSTLQAQVQDFKKLVDAGQLRKSDLAEFLNLLEEMSDVIVRSTRRAAELVTSFKQVAVDRSSERRREFDVATLVQELVTAFKPGMRQRNIEVSTSIPAGIGCDSFPGPLGQVITNLIQNAMTHAFSDGISGLISIDAQTEGDRVVLHVRDNGRGMDEYTINHAFDPFFTTRLGQGGSGLGLSVSHRIATTVLNGSLSASSVPGQGSCFTLSFQRRLAKEA